MNPSLSTAVAELARKLSPDNRRAVASAMRSATGPGDLSPAIADQSVVRPLRIAWRAEAISGRELAAALETAGMAVDAERGASHVSLVLTGPSTDHPVPRIEQTLQGLIGRAEQELLLVSFVAYRADTIVRALRDAISRSVRVTLVLETEFADEDTVEDTVDLREARRLAPDVVDASVVLVWPLGKRPRTPNGNPARLHAKVAVADRSEALVSSANLTGFAMDFNIEAGLAVKGAGIGAALCEYFDHLRADGVLEVWGGGPGR